MSFGIGDSSTSLGSTCRECGAEVAASVIFCTSCGFRLEEPALRLAAPPANDVPPAAVAKSEPAEVVVASASPGWFGSRALRFAAIAVAALTLASAAGFFLYSWRVEIDKRTETQTALLASEEQVEALSSDKARLTKQNAALTKSLASAEATASRRGQLLSRTDKVLDGVEPLLSTVDSLKALTADMQDGRFELETESTAVINDLWVFADYVTDISPLYWDIDYLTTLLDEIGAGSQAMRSASSHLDGLDARYVKASKQFETRATGFAANVRNLETKLKSER